MELSPIYAVTSFALGALHALEPGHGKTVVGAYLIGAQGKPIHAIMLGIIVTLTHTFVIILLAVAATIAVEYWTPEKVEHKLKIVSGIIIFGLGMWLINRNYRMIKSHANNHTHDTHLHTGDPLSITALVTLGVSGGIVPCPGALAVLLTAIGIGKFAEGIILVIIFSLGLASVLIAIGIIMVTAVGLAKRLFDNKRWLDKLPLISAILITLLGAILTLKSIF